MSFSPEAGSGQYERLADVEDPIEYGEHHHHAAAERHRLASSGVPRPPGSDGSAQGYPTHTGARSGSALRSKDRKKKIGR